MSLRVIVGIRDLTEDNTRMKKPELDSVSTRWTVQHRYVGWYNIAKAGLGVHKVSEISLNKLDFILVRPTFLF